MRPDAAQIKRIVVVMMENRSFNTLLGYMSLDEFGKRDVDGLKNDPAWNAAAASIYNSTSYLPWHSDDPFSLMPGDPPHERDPIKLQLGTPTNGVFPMNGFVKNYANVCPVKPGDRPPVMSYFTPAEAPITAFLADNFAVCDRWFSALPAGTQANRLIAMGGSSKIDSNTFPLPDQDLVYDWLNAKNIPWRVYHEGLPFFVMMPKWTLSIFDEKYFRRFTRLDNDLMQSLPDELPKVMFMEPTYTDAPHIGASTDDHAPTAVKAGQEFLLKVYKAFSSLPDVWAGTVIIVTYDEHGGFFDHVSPPSQITKAPNGEYDDFQSLGVRVPALIISPLVAKGTIFHGQLDHTSILKFIGQVFGGGSYTPDVDERGVGSVWDVLNVANSDATPPPAPQNLIDYLARQIQPAGYTPGKPAHNESAKSFKIALDKMQNQMPVQAAAKFPELQGQVFAP
jgi:phospholipase C